jgi:hypothetical protein
VLTKKYILIYFQERDWIIDFFRMYVCTYVQTSWLIFFFFLSVVLELL